MSLHTISVHILFCSDVMSDFEREDEGITIEGFAGGGKPRQKTATPAVLEPVPSRSRWWVLLIVSVLVLGSAVFGSRYYRAKHEFVVTGQLLYKDGVDANPVPGAIVVAFRLNARSRSPLFSADGKETVYALLRDRQFQLKMYAPQEFLPYVPGPIHIDPTEDAKLAPLRPLGYAPLSAMDRVWWETTRLNNCGGMLWKFAESLDGYAERVEARTDSNGTFSLKLKRGNYYVAAEDEVPARALLYEDRPVPMTGAAFWFGPVEVRGDTRIVLASADCSPD
jgi:hypothetical protein